MSEEEKQESQKTVVAFIAGLLIGGLLVWVFGGSPSTDPVADTPDESNTEEVTETPSGSTGAESNGTTVTQTNTPTPQPELPVGDGSVSVQDQPAGTSISLTGATYPSDEGWIGVRDYVDGQLGGLLGVVRYSKEQGLIPEAIILQRPTVAGKTYAVVFYSESGDRVFNLAEDVQIGGAVETFVAQ